MFRHVRLTHRFHPLVTALVVTLMLAAGAISVAPPAAAGDGIPEQCVPKSGGVDPECIAFFACEEGEERSSLVGIRSFSGVSGDGNPIVVICDNENDNNNDQSNDQDQNQEPGQEQEVDQDNDNTDTQDNSISGNAGALAESGCGATQGDDGTGADNTSCESGGAEAGDSSTGDSNQANVGEQSSDNSNSQGQWLTGGNQANAPESTTNQNASNELEDVGGDVDNGVVITTDDHSDDDVTDNKDGEIDQSQDNDDIDGNGNQVNLVENLLEQLGILLRQILRSLPSVP